MIGSVQIKPYEETAKQEQDVPILSLCDIYKSFDETNVLRGIRMEVRSGEFVTLLGPSGCGKTTLLRIIAGLEEPDSGRVLLGGQDVTMFPPEKRNVNTIFQNYALFPHMNVANNIAYGMRVRKVPRYERNQRIEKMLELVQLEGFERRRPEQLSGGQRQRVAIARALVNEPDLLLLDEPLGALDLQLRRQMQKELKQLQKKLGITFIYITHDQEEALNMSDRVAIMNGGRFEQIGTVDEVYERPVTRFAAQFIGASNILNGYIRSVHADGTVEVAYAQGIIRAKAYGPYKQGDEVDISLRAEQVRFGKDTMHGFDLRGVIVEHSYVGGTRQTVLRMKNDQLIEVRGFRAEEKFPQGEEVYVYWDPKHVAVIGRGTS